MLKEKGKKKVLTARPACTRTSQPWPDTGFEGLAPVMQRPSSGGSQELSSNRQPAPASKQAMIVRPYP